MLSEWMLGAYRSLGNTLFDRFRGIRGEPSQPRGTIDLWVHGASAGELEMLFPIIDRALARGLRVHVSALSRSADQALERLRQERGDQGLTAGYSPAEGRWLGAIRMANPQCVITAKYEAWPDLWASCGRLGVPIVILGAQPRGSLAIARAALDLFDCARPELRLGVFPGAESLANWRADLGAPWKASEFSCIDPRWERVFTRQARLTNRTKTLHQWAERYVPRPWGVLGSAWASDLRVFEDAGVNGETVPGSVWIFPHALSQVRLAETMQYARHWARQLGGAAIVTRQGLPELGSKTPRVIVVDELGVLAEFYRFGDWAYVGGGFHRPGIHSVIEPAVAGLAVAAGPRKFDRFPETRLLVEAGQLSAIQSPRELAVWLRERAPKRGGAAWDWSRFDRRSDETLTKILTPGG